MEKQKQMISVRPMYAPPLLYVCLEQCLESTIREHNKQVIRHDIDDQVDDDGDDVRMYLLLLLF